jgi:hypothetical protein
MPTAGQVVEHALHDVSVVVPSLKLEAPQLVHSAMAVAPPAHAFARYWPGPHVVGQAAQVAALSL